MSTVRVVLVAMSPLLENLVTELLRGATDIELSGTFPTMEASALDRDPRVRVLLVGPRATDRQIDDALFGRPRLTVLRVEAGGHDLSLHQLRPERRKLRKAGRERLLGAIREAIPADAP